MKNAEKYAKQIAGILADSAICPVTDLISSQSPDDWPVCTNCALEGVCANAQKLEVLLLQEVSSLDRNTIRGTYCCVTRNGL